MRPESLGMSLTMSYEEIARVCHSANRGLQALTGEAVSPDWDDATEQTRESAIIGVKHAMQGATPEQLHSSWMNTKARQGYVYGTVKDDEAKTHPCMVAYDALPPTQRIKDAVFQAIVVACTQTE